LGMPLSLGRLRMVHLQHVLDRARSHLASWKGRWINTGGRQALASSVLSAIPVFAMTALKLPPKFIQEFDIIRCNCLWDIDEETNPGASAKCGGSPSARPRRWVALGCRAWNSSVIPYAYVGCGMSGASRLTPGSAPRRLAMPRTKNFSTRPLGLP
jgi:hypothetical protein